MYFFGGTTGKETHPGWLRVCKSYLRIVLRRNWGQLTCEREERINMVMHPMFSQVLMQEGDQPPSHKGRCGGRREKLPDSGSKPDTSDLCLHPSCPGRGWEPGWTPGAEGRASGCWRGAFFLASPALWCSVLWKHEVLGCPPLLQVCPPQCVTAGVLL